MHRWGIGASEALCFGRLAKVEMPEATRQLMLRICDGCPHIPPVLYQLYRYRRRHEIFEWLVQHHFIGVQLLGWLKAQHEGSPLKLAAFVISMLEREARPRPVVIDRDYLPN